MIALSMRNAEALKRQKAMRVHNYAESEDVSTKKKSLL